MSTQHSITHEVNRRHLFLFINILCVLLYPSPNSVMEDLYTIYKETIYIGKGFPIPAD